MIKRKRRKKHKRKPEPRIRVKPSPEIEERVSREVAKANLVMRGLTTESLLTSPYLVSAIYYHDGLLDTFDENKTGADPADRIVAHIVRAFNSQTKRNCIQLLRESCALSFSELGPGRFVVPVPYERPLAHGRAVHPYAIDLFTAEGTPVRSATRGLVVLAENDWQPNEWFSTSTVRGGNTVIVFDPDASRFLRYAHLERAVTQPGAFAEAGDIIGYVGHTGFNAARAGHGRHLHFEINEFHSGIVEALPNEELEALLEAASATCPEYAPPTAPQISQG